MRWVIVKKKAVIVISLVEESSEKTNEAIESEIFKELSELPLKIPWMKKVDKVTVKESYGQFIHWGCLREQ